METMKTKILTKVIRPYKLKKTNKVLCIAIAIITLLSLICAISADINRACTNIVINFKEINEGQNPDSSPFNAYEIKNDEVLKLACEKLNNRITPKELKKHLSISSNTTEGDLEEVNQAILDGHTTYIRNASLYTVSYDIVSDRIKAEGIGSVISSVFKGITYPSKTKILNAVSKSYSEYYGDTYIVNDDVLATDWTHIEESDYYNQSAIIQSVLNRMSRYFGNCYDIDTEFVSKEYNVGFGDLQRQVTNIINLDWQNYNSYIIKNGLTTNKDFILKQFSFMKKNYELSNKRNLSEYGSIKEGIEKYDPSVTKVVFIPALDSVDNFYMNRTRIGIDYMVENANAVKIDADTDEYNTEYCAYLIDSFSKSDAASPEELENADKMRDDIIEKVDAICETAFKVNNEYRLAEAYTQIIFDKATDFDGFVFFAVKFAKTFIKLSMFVLFAYFIIDFVRQLRLKDRFFEEV